MNTIKNTITDQTKKHLKLDSNLDTHLAHNTLGRAKPGAAQGNEKWGSKRGRLWQAREREPITGVWGRSPSGVQGQSPWSGGQEAKPL